MFLMKEISKLGEMKATLIIGAFDTCITSILGVVKDWVKLVLKKETGVTKISGKHYEK